MQIELTGDVDDDVNLYEKQPIMAFASFLKQTKLMKLTFDSPPLK